MKKKLLNALALPLFIFFASQTHAQSKTNFIPEKGYWQLVSNIHDGKTVTVKFYSEQNELIYEETILNTRINPDRKKVRKQLYYALQDAYKQWAFNKQVSSANLVARRK
jgi:hypothetical protein